MIPLIEVSIVIGSNENLIFGCLDSILANTATPLKITIIANPASPQVISEIKEKYPDVSVIQNKDRKGFAENHNGVLVQSQYKYVLILNDDTIVHAGAIDEAFRYMEEHQDVGMVGARLLNTDGSYQNSVFAWPRLWQTLAVFAGTLFPILKYPIIHQLYRRAYMGKDDYGYAKVARVVPCVKGAFMLVRREIVDYVGPMDEVTYVYEEVEWQRRFWLCGYKVAFVPLAVVTHYGSSTINSYNMALVELVKWAVNYYEKHSSALSVLLLRIDMVIMFFIRLLNPLTKRERRSVLVAAIRVLLNPDKYFEGKVRYFTSSHLKINGHNLAVKVTSTVPKSLLRSKKTD